MTQMEFEWGEQIYGLTHEDMGRLKLAGNPERVKYWPTWPLVFALPADHPYYLATEKGFTYWPGGESAPGDWDGGPVLLWNGLDKGFGGDWRHGARVPPSTEIIGYRRKIDPTIAELKLPNPVSEWSLARVRELSGASAIEYAFARYIQAHEQPPVDPDVLAVREILATWCGSPVGSRATKGVLTRVDAARQITDGEYDTAPEFVAALVAYRATLPK